MTYFVDPYKSYYEKLSQASGMSSSVSSITGKMGDSKTAFSKIQSSLANSNWKEKGIEELKQNTMPMIEKTYLTISNNISKVLSGIVGLAGDLCNAAKSLKEEDEKYDELKGELAGLAECPMYDGNGKENPEYSSYINKKTQLEKDIRDAEDRCKKAVQECDSIVSSIKALDNSVEEVEFSSMESGLNNNTLSSASIIESVNNGKMLKVSCEGREFYVVNTKINPIDYQRYVQENGLYQNKGLLPGDCMLLSQYYAMDMLRGTYTSGSAMAQGQGSPATRIDDYVQSPNREDVLNYIYNESLEGRPTVLQATQVRSSEGLRHLVTFIGFSTDVESIADLTANNILVLDCVDGQVQTLAKARAEGGHERDLYAQGGTYFARGATTAFKEKEVYNEEWQRNHSAAA